MVSDSLGLLAFVIRLVNFVFYLPNGQVMSWNSNKTRTVKSTLLVKMFWMLVKITSGLVNARFSLPEWQAVKMIFFAPCLYMCKANKLTHFQLNENIDDQTQFLRTVRSPISVDSNMSVKLLPVFHKIVPLFPIVVMRENAESFVVTCNTNSVCSGL